MKTLILGIGNLLWADEGFGIRCVETMDAMYSFNDKDNVELMDGGTLGLYLVQHVQDADNLIVFDAIDYGLKPGEIKVIEDDDVPKYMGSKKISLHQTGFQEVLATACLMDDYPERIILIGVQPEYIEDFGGSLRDSVNAQIFPCIEIAVKYLKELGITPIKNKVIEKTLVQKELAQDRYENERPSEKVALRTGDERVLLNSDFSEFKVRDVPRYHGVGNVKSVPVDGRKLFEDK